MYLVDSHCHLNMLKEFSLADLMKSTKENHVQYMQTICTNIEDIPIIFKIIKENDNIFGSVGIHPSECGHHNIEKNKLSDEDINLLHTLGLNREDVFLKSEQLVYVSNNPKIIGIGETGLDYYYNQTDEQHKQQMRLFAEHINASQVSKLPLIVHTRDAEADTTDIIKSEMHNQQYTGLIHCFTASKNFAKKMLDLGLYISFSGIITFKNTADLQEIVKFVPLDRLLIETDAPFLAPVPMRGKTNQPAFVKYVAEKISELKSCSIEEVAHTTSTNFFTLFNKAKINYNASSG